MGRKGFYDEGNDFDNISCRYCKILLEELITKRDSIVTNHIFDTFRGEICSTDVGMRTSHGNTSLLPSFKIRKLSGNRRGRSPSCRFVSVE